MTRPLIVSYYTDDDKYRPLAEALEMRLLLLKMDYHFYKVTNQGNWALKASHKPGVILEAMREYPDRDIIWMDIDAVPRFLPELMYEDRFDFVVGSYYPWWFVANLIKFSGTSDTVRQILRYWEYHTPRYPHYTDELLLTNAWHAMLASGRPLRYAILNKLQCAGVSQLNVSDRKDSPGLFHQAHLSEAYKRALTKRDFNKIWTLDEIVIER